MDGKLTPWALRDIVVTELRTYAGSVNPTESAALLEWEIELIADRIIDRVRGAPIKRSGHLRTDKDARRYNDAVVTLSNKIRGIGAP